ncbi:MAG TPA: hypothetical protein VGE13_04390 [Candidatus Saccharimonadales bacterium]
MDSEDLEPKTLEFDDIDTGDNLYWMDVLTSRDWNEEPQTAEEDKTMFVIQKDGTVIKL